MPDVIPEFLVGYLEERKAARAEAVNAVLASLTERERALVKDAAVMGYVQGLMRDRSEGCPKDSQVMSLVVDACLALPDLYPAITVARPVRPLDPDQLADGHAVPDDGD